MISQAVEVHYPGAQYSVSGKLVTLPGETHKQYRVEITSEYDEARYTTFNKAACAHLDKNTEVIAIISNGGLSPQKGKGGSCQYWLSK